MDKKTKRARQFFYYAGHILAHLAPNGSFRRRCESKLSRLGPENSERIMHRVDYYHRMAHPFTVSEDATPIRDIKAEGHTTYYYDLRDILRYFDDTMKVDYIFGDVLTVPNTPSFVKSRPVGADNQNSILLKLNALRHFHFARKDIPFAKKKDMAVWRGKCHSNPVRLEFVKKNHAAINLNIGDSDPNRAGKVGYKGYMSIREQLTHKFIVSIEGRDVASNLKWIMSSNSVCLMPRPKYETWFCEGQLVPDHHYVLLKDDLSDLEEKIDYYRTNSDEALAIIDHANRYVDQFRDGQDEELVALLVAKKYFRLSGQLP